MNAKPKINQKIETKFEPFSPRPAAADWRHLQHIRTFIGLSRRPIGVDDVLRLIDTRQIRWAWDIARQGARRQEVRIWRESLTACLARESADLAAAPDDDLTLSQVIEAILPRPAALARRAAAIGLHELQRRFLCCRMHINGLIDDGELCRVGKLRPGETPQVLYQSAVEFLKRRVMST